MKKIVALTDYKGKFGSKHFDNPYRSGMDKEMLKSVFRSFNIEIQYLQFVKLANLSCLPDDIDYAIYTSSEDIGYFYKNFIEDIVFWLEIMGVKVIPEFKYLKANNNKVFMELMRKSIGDKFLREPDSLVFGSLEELAGSVELAELPAVLKTASGASGTGVFKAVTNKRLMHIAKMISSTRHLYYDLKEIGRAIKHNGYIKESRFRKKFIVQKMIPNLKNDWKLYFMYDKFYIFYRPILKYRDFKASGGGYSNYYYGDNAESPEGIFDFASMILSYFNVPHASLDIAWDGERFYLIEIQFVYFGTAGIPYSTGYYTKKGCNWVYIEEKLQIEEVYANSIAGFINASVS